MVFVTSRDMRNVACSVMAVAKLGAVCGDYPAGGVIVKRVDDNVINGLLGILSAKQRAFDDIFEFPNIPWPVMTL